MARYVDMDACPCNKCKHIMSGNCLPQYQGCQNYEEWYEGVEAIPVSFVRKWIDEHPTDYTTVESMLTDWREEGDSDEVERC